MALLTRSAEARRGVLRGFAACALTVALLWQTAGAVLAAARPWVGFGSEDNVYCGIETEERVIALTFDDGPHPRYTPEILDILSEYGVKATFFMVGENVSYYPEVARRVASEGHEIGNHTFDHGCLRGMSAAKLRDEMSSADGEILRVCGVRPMVFRPPEGCCNRAVVDAANSFGYKIVLWTVDPRDWSSPPAERVAETLIDGAAAGAVLLCHDYNSARRNPTPEALRKVIPELLSRGYRFVTVSELLGAE